MAPSQAIREMGIGLLGVKAPGTNVLTSPRSDSPHFP
jgi:hypothetical protein